MKHVFGIKNSRENSVIQPFSSNHPSQYRYIAIHQPLKYHQIMARDRMMQLVTICWISIIGATVLKDVVMWKFDGGPRFVAIS
jgi:hypothetical protein